LWSLTREEYRPYRFGWIVLVGVTGFNRYSMVVLVIGAIVVLVGYHLVAGRRAVT
jgi:uncharacterized membrane protein YeaQ/YmgE (transglycosylase-associated protein family)